MNGKELAASLRGGKRVYGTLIVSPAPEWVKAVGGLGLDYVFIDTEHVALDRAQLSWMCRAYAAINMAPVVRVPAPDPYHACMALDGGAAGVIAPYVETAEQVRQLVGAVKHRPVKGQFLRAGNLPADTRRYVEANNAGNSLIVNVESVPAVDALDEILAVPGLDAVLVGPHDLSCSLGMPEQWHNPGFVQAVDTIITKARAQGIGAGIHVIYETGLEQEVRWAKLGANLILHQADILAFRFAMKRDLTRLRQELGEAGAPSQTGNLNI